MKLPNNSLKYFIFIFIVLLVLIFLVFFFNGKISLTGAAHFNLNTPYIKAVVQPGESVTIPITITNIDVDKDQNFSISYKKGSTDFIRLGNNNLMIEAQEGEYFNVHLNGSLPKGIYVSSISVKGGDEEIYVPVVLEVESDNPLFDISSTVTSPYSQVALGDLFVVDVIIYNLRSLKENVNVNYTIYNLEGTLLYSESQSLNVADRLQMTKTFTIPKQAGSGDYILAIIAQHKESLGTSTTLFTAGDYKPIVKTSVPNYNRIDKIIIIIALTLIAILVISFLALNYYWNKQLINNAQYWSQNRASPKKPSAVVQIPYFKPKKEVGVEKEIKKSRSTNINGDIKKLEYQKELLAKAYEKGYIRKSSYELGISRINALINKLRKSL